VPQFDVLNLPNDCPTLTCRKQRVNKQMTREEFPRLARRAVLVSFLIQMPFMILINLGVHSLAGGIGYLFYYPWIVALEGLYRRIGESWQINWPLYETVLCLLQTIPLSVVVFLLMAFKHRAASDGGSARGHI
jgi:hypothetical protein